MNQSHPFANKIILPGLAPLQSPLHRPTKRIGHTQQRLGARILHVEHHFEKNFLRVARFCESVTRFGQRRFKRPLGLPLTAQDRLRLTSWATYPATAPVHTAYDIA